jgi:hypothetical protein
MINEIHQQVSEEDTHAGTARKRATSWFEASVPNSGFKLSIEIYKLC